MLWNDKLWEIKNVSSHSSIDHAIRNGLKQIIDNQGGIILNIDNSKLELDEIKNVIQKRFNRTGEEYKNLNVILVKNDKILENMTIEKEAFPSAKRGTSSASYNSNSIINIAKSQLKNDEKDDKINTISSDRINKLLSNTSLEDKYKQVTTIEEAKVYAKNILNIELTNLEKSNIDILNIMLKESSRVYDKFGDLSKSQVLEGIRKVKFSKDSNVVAGYQSGYKEVFVDKIMSKKDLQSIIDDAIENHNVGAWSTGAKEHFIRHELGHAVECLYNTPNKKLKLNNIINNLKNELGIVGDIKLSGFSSKDIDIIKKAGDKLSYYALKNYKELVAESVAEFMNGNPREVAQEVISVLMEGVV